MKKRRDKKGAMWWDNLGWALIALAVLAIVILGIWLLSQKGINLIDKLKEVLRFGR